ncbi:MAG TPA: hypothetical protein PLF31_03240 [Candidatus Paceibacterota bacterium]|nr:hypothetical protein [Candidatus Paceibacterota bacterium]
MAVSETTQGCRGIITAESRDVLALLSNPAWRIHPALVEYLMREHTRGVFHQEPLVAHCVPYDRCMFRGTTVDTSNLYFVIDGICYRSPRNVFEVLLGAMSFSLQGRPCVALGPVIETSTCVGMPTEAYMPMFCSSDGQRTEIGLVTHRRSRNRFHMEGGQFLAFEVS